MSNGYRTLRTWKTKDGREFTGSPEQQANEAINPNAVTPNGQYVATESKGLWHIWNTLTQTTLPVTPLEIEVDSFGRPALSDDGNVLTFVGKEEGATDNSLFIYKRHDSSYVKVQRFLIGCPAPILSASSAQNYVAILCEGQAVQIRDLNDGRDRTPEGQKKLKGVQSFKITPDGKHLAIIFKEGDKDVVGVWRYDASKAVKILRGNGEITIYEFNSANDHFMATFGVESVDIQILDIRNRSVKEVIGNGEISATAFSRDEKFLAVADFTGLVRIIDVATGDDVVQLQPEGTVNNIVFSSDGKYLAATSGPGNNENPPADEAWLLHVWLLKPKDLIKEACQRLSEFQLSDNQLRYCNGRTKKSVKSVDEVVLIRDIRRRDLLTLSRKPRKLND